MSNDLLTPLRIGELHSVHWFLQLCLEGGTQFLGGNIPGPAPFPELYQSLIVVAYFCFSYMWGVLADRRGRKPIILVSSVCVAISTIAFGFSVNFAMAVVMRVLMGITSGKKIFKGGQGENRLLRGVVVIPLDANCSILIHTTQFPRSSGGPDEISSPSMTLLHQGPV